MHFLFARSRRESFSWNKEEINPFVRSDTYPKRWLAK